MKKNKLYTANRWNQPAFMVDRESHNIFDGFTLGQSNQMYRNPFGIQLLNSSNSPVSNDIMQKAPNINWSNPVQRNMALGQTKAIAGSSGSNNPIDIQKSNQMLSKSIGGSSKKGGIFGNNTGWGGLGALAGGVTGALSGIQTGDPRGMWDTLDPVFHLAEGRETKAGNVMSDAGVALTQAGLSSGQPYLALAGAGMKILGGLTNAAFGIKVDEDKLNKANENLSELRNFRSNADSFDAIKGPVATESVSGTYEGGWFSHDRGQRKQRALENSMQEARQLAFRAVNNNIHNLSNDQMNDALANYSAFGGPIETGDMGAIDYGFMSDYLTQRKRENDVKSKMNGIVPMPAFMPNSYAIGGDLQTNGGDWSDGLVTIGAGGSHEKNKYQGVQLGVDSEGIPNLVEENETIFNDYVYSNRILADEATKQLFRLPKKKDITFAEISKKLEKEIAERPNDPISKSAFEKQMAELADEQERQKQEMEAERAKAAFDALSPEEQTALMQQKAEQEAMAQQAAIQEAAAQQQPTPEELAIAQQQQQMADGSEAALGQEPEMAANGGKLFAPGGYLWDKFWSSINEYSKKKGNTQDKYQIDNEWKGNIKELEDSEAYKAFTDYILNDATDEERMKYFQWIDANTGRDNKYITDGKLADNWKDMYQAARTDGLYGIQHYTPEWQVAEATQEPSVLTPPSPTSTPRVFHAMVDDDDYIQGELDPKVVGAEVRRETLPNGDTVIYHDRVKSIDDVGSGNSNKGVIPDLKKETYFGLFGPAVGLGLMGLGLGKPDTGSYDAAVSGAGNYTIANWKPLGNYLTYRPLDIWYEQNVLNAQSRATDRALANNSGGNRGTAMAGLIANGYNSQLASGNLFRQAQEYNDNLRKQVADFNRGTDQFNSEQYGATSRFNASAYNDANRASAQMKLHAASAKDDANRWWASNFYGNINGLFDNINQWEKWKRDHNSVARMAANGVFGVGTENTPIFGGYVKEDKKGKRSASNGGKLKKKKRGLTI